MGADEDEHPAIPLPWLPKDIHRAHGLDDSASSSSGSLPGSRQGHAGRQGAVVHPRAVEELEAEQTHVWRWRMIILNALSGVSSNSFGGIVEADETYQRESRKGSREWVRHLRNPSQHPKPPRRRWYEYGKKGIPMMRRLSRWQLPILTVADQGGARRFRRIAGRSNGTI